VRLVSSEFNGFTFIQVSGVPPEADQVSEKRNIEAET
jgi:hypothetical protein